MPETPHHSSSSSSSSSSDTIKAGTYYLLAYICARTFPRGAHECILIYTLGGVEYIGYDTSTMHGKSSQFALCTMYVCMYVGVPYRDTSILFYMQPSICNVE